MNCKTITKAGGLTIPKAARLAAQMYPGTIVDIITTGDSIVIRPHERHCAICGSTEDVVSVGEVSICKRCARRILNDGK